jgi:hypothetical protein
MQIEGVGEVGDRGGAVGVGEADQKCGGAVDGADGSIVGARGYSATHLVG